MTLVSTPQGTTHLSAAARHAAASAVLELLSDGYLSLYSGRRPIDADEPLNGQELLVELRFATPAFEMSSAGCAQARPLIPGRAVRSGDASFFRCYTADHAEAVLSGGIGKVGDEDLDDDDNAPSMFLNETSITAGAAVLIPSFAYAQAG